MPTTKTAKKSTKKPVAKKPAARRKPAARNHTARKGVAHREGTVRAKLEELYKKHGYADAKKEAIKKGFNKFTVQKQLYLIHTGQ